MKTALVIPCFMAKKMLKKVLKGIPKFVNFIILVDDNCPEKTVSYTLKTISDKRIYAIYNKQNIGVGGSVLIGYKKAIELGSDLVIKIDSDGQMDLSKLPKIFKIFKADRDLAYVKGNRFYSIKSIIKMPFIRLFGNLILTLMNKFSSGYWKINDPTNGYTAINTNYLKRLKLNKIKKNFFFESDMLFHLNCLGAKVYDIDIEAKYNVNNSSTLVIYKVIPYFIKNHIINFAKRIFRNVILLILYLISITLFLSIFLNDLNFIFFLIIFLLTILYDITKQPK